METRIKAFEVRGLGDIKTFNSIVNEKDKRLVIGNQLLQKEKIKDILKKLKEKGVITNIRYPSNKKIQKELDELVTTKRQIVKTLEQIRIVF